MAVALVGRTHRFVVPKIGLIDSIKKYMEIREKDAEYLCFIKKSAAIALVGRTQRVVVLKTGGQFPDPRLSAFEPLPA